MLPQELKQLLAAAEAAVQNHTYWQAVNLYTDVLSQTDPQTVVPDIKESRLSALRERGRLLGILGEQEAALAAHEQYQREAGLTRHGVVSLIYIGQHSRGLGRYQEALSAYEKALTLAEQLGDANGQARALMGVGSTRLVQGNTEQALDCFVEAHAHFQASGNIHGQTQTHNLVGVAQASSGRLDEAIQAFKSGLELAQHIHNQEREAVLLNNLGECYQLLFAAEQALACHQAGLALAEEAHLRLIEADVCRNIGIDLSYLGRIDESIAYLQRALSISRDTGNVDIEQHTLFALADVEMGQGHYEAARTYAQTLQKMAVSRNAHHHLAAALYLIGLTQQQQGDYAAAEETWQEAQFLAHETMNRMLLWRIHAAQATIAATPGLANVHWRIAHEITQHIANSVQDTSLRDTFLQAAPVRAVFTAMD